MSDTDLLREAATRIRYLAGPPVDWDADSHDWDVFEVREQDERGWFSRLIGRSRRPLRALHVAAWDPKVAHLVADMLACAASLDPSDRETVALGRCGMCGTAHLTDIALALTGEA